MVSVDTFKTKWPSSPLPSRFTCDVCIARTEKIIEMEQFWGWALPSKALASTPALISKHPGGSGAARVRDHVGEHKCLGWSDVGTAGAPGRRRLPHLRLATISGKDRAARPISAVRRPMAGPVALLRADAGLVFAATPARTESRAGEPASEEGRSVPSRTWRDGAGCASAPTRSLTPSGTPSLSD